MSASDAAPLPRLGEVFFDVRGSSRSMRLSWYADTGVAVFSIWQGGMCTGTFRLPIDDLPRMVEILQRGPQARRRPEAGDYGANWQAAPADHGPAQDYDHGAGQDYPTGSYWQSDEGGYRPDAYQPDAYQPDAYQPDASGSGRAGGTGGYGQERFVPPYIQAPGESYVNDNPADRTDHRDRFGGPAYPGGRQQDPSRRQQYQEPPWTPGGYSDDPQYRLAADKQPVRRHSAGRDSETYRDRTGRPVPAEADIEMTPNRPRQRDY